MNSITGKILHQESGQGISDLVVASFDLDPVLLDPSNGNEALQKSMLALYGRLFSGSKLSDDDVDLYLKAIYFGITKDSEEDEILKTPNTIAGDRLGSVLTDINGEFTLEYADRAFQVNDQEIRPDLVLLVMAPEYSVEISLSEEETQTTGQRTRRQFVPVPDYLRLLHFTLFPRRNAGRRESAVIKITSKQLQAQNIPVPNLDSKAVDFQNEITTDARRKASILAGMKGLREEELTKHREREHHSQMLVRNLSAVPKNIRNSGFFVENDRSASRVTTNAREHGLRNIASYATSASANIMLSDRDLAALGVTDIPTFKESLTQNNHVTQRLSLERICALLQHKNGGVELNRRFSDLLQGLKNPDVGSDDVGDDPNDGDDAQDSDHEVGRDDEVTLSTEEQIKRIVLERVKSMQVFDPKNEPDADQITHIRNTINRLVPPVSPADVTAFYDFHHLQIAFPDIWAEAFDGNISSLIRKIDIQYREYTDELEVARDSAEENPSRLRDLDDYTDLMQKLTGEIASLNSQPPMTLKVKELIQPFLGYKEKDLETAWQRLSLEQKEILIQISTDQITEETVVQSDRLGGSFETQINSLLESGDASLVNAGIQLLREVKKTNELQRKPISSEEKLRRAFDIISNPEGRYTRVQDLLKSLDERLQEPHAFRIFQKNTVNFGIVTSYRQEWKPGNYQVGGMVASMPLTPGETRKYSKKEILKSTFMEEEQQETSSAIAAEASSTTRATSDIVEKATTKTNFEQQVQAKISGNIGIFSLGANTNTTFSRNQAVESQNTKKTFSEAVRKASQEYRNERSLQVTTELTSESESIFTSEISNPNNEITVTYLFYELERQYRVNQRLHRLTPVVLVAQEIPNPADVNDTWLLAHEWILRKALLDDSLGIALDYLADGLVGDEVSIEVKREHYETQKELVEELSETMTSLTSMQDVLRESLIDTTNREKVASAYARRNKKSKRKRRLRFAFSGRLKKLAKSIRNDEFSFGNPDDDPALLEARREALETRLGYLEENLEDSRSQLLSANSSLAEATSDLTRAIQDSFTRRNLVNQLRIHVKENILYYMQTIWSFEHPDQRYFRLYDIPLEIPIPQQTETRPAQPNRHVGNVSANIRFTIQHQDRISAIYQPLIRNHRLADEIFARISLPIPSIDYQEKALHEVADLNHLLGFKGNYMIFPLKQCTYITDFMMQDYIDDYLGLRDPDRLGEFSIDDLKRYSAEIQQSDNFTHAEKEETQQAITRLIQDKLTNPQGEDELVVVPTGQLFIEALKGEHALLENFKLLHRQLDVQKVEEEVRIAQLESLRYALRLSQDDPILSDPSIEKQIIVDAKENNVIVDTE